MGKKPVVYGKCWNAFTLQVVPEKRDCDWVQINHSSPKFCIHPGSGQISFVNKEGSNYLVFRIIMAIHSYVFHSILTYESNQSWGCFSQTFD